MLKGTVIGVACFATLLSASDQTGRKSLRSASIPSNNTTAQGTVGRTQLLSGTLVQFDTERNIAIVRTSDGVTYNFLVSHSTRLSSRGQAIALADLSEKAGSRVTIKFAPTRKGNIANSVETGQ